MQAQKTRARSSAISTTGSIPRRLFPLFLRDPLCECNPLFVERDVVREIVRDVCLHSHVIEKLSSS